MLSWPAPFARAALLVVDLVACATRSLGASKITGGHAGGRGKRCCKPKWRLERFGAAAADRLRIGCEDVGSGLCERRDRDRLHENHETASIIPDGACA